MFVYSHATDMNALRGIIKSGAIEPRPIHKTDLTEFTRKIAGENTPVSFWAKGKSFFFEAYDGVEVIIVVDLDFPLIKSWAWYVNLFCVTEEWLALEPIPLDKIIEVYVNSIYLEEAQKMFVPGVIVSPLHIDRWRQAPAENGRLGLLLQGAFNWKDDVEHYIVVEKKYQTECEIAATLPPGTDYSTAVTTLYKIAERYRGDDSVMDVTLEDDENSIEWVPDDFLKGDK